MNEQLATSFRYHRFDGLTATRALAKARADVAKGTARYPEPGAPGTRGHGNYWPQGERKLVRYVRGVESVLRLIGTSYDICRSEHSRRVDNTGWYLDSFQDETVTGVVAQLPAREGKPVFVPGYRTSLDESNDGGATLFFDQLTDDKLDAASWADSEAERMAESERAYSGAWQAGSRWSSLGEEVAEHRGAVLKLCCELKLARRATVDDETAPGWSPASAETFPAICETIRAAIKSHLRDIRKARKTRARLLDGQGYSDRDYEESFYTGDSRLRSAFNEGAGETVFA